MISIVTRLLQSVIVFLPMQYVFAQQDFQEYYDQVYQIRVISSQAGSKSSIGSGFQVTLDGLIVTNYHVVSSFVLSPETFQIEYQSHTGEKGSLQLLDFDVVNDLAVLRHSNPQARVLNFARQDLNKGEIVYALGNPHDYGTTLVNGANNGMVEHSYNDKILYSGSLNSGMSGGPALNENGEVVGVNVATAGSQLSFLVPAKKAMTLVDAKREIAQADYLLEIAKQIKSWQRPRVQELIDQEWGQETFAGLNLFGEIRKDFQCWGRTNDDNEARHVEHTSKSCRSGDSIYLDPELSAGELYFSFEHSKTLDLNATQFVARYQSIMRPRNKSNFEHSTNFQCHTDFVDNKNAQSFVRVTTCIRAYKKIRELYDSLFLVEQVRNDEKVISHFSVSAVEKDQIQAVNQKFFEELL